MIVYQVRTRFVLDKSCAFLNLPSFSKTKLRALIMASRYFDHNATTPLRPEAREAWLQAVDTCWLNPSSPYRAAAKVHAHLESAREKTAALLEVPANRIVFNSGATEGNNAIFAYWASTLSTDALVGVSPTEHPSVTEAAKHYFGDRILWLALDKDGAVDPQMLEYLLQNNRRIKAISVMAANNETGILNDWAAIAEICRTHAIHYHCDASQWIGRLPTDGLAKCSFVTCCAHKLGGPRGLGISILPEIKIDFRSLLGGSQESGHRAGTENVAGILAMVAALEAAETGCTNGRDKFIKQLLRDLPNVKVIGGQAKRLWNTVMLVLPEFENTRWVRLLEKRRFFISSGSACSTGVQGPSKVLAAMGLAPEEMRRAVRVSSGWSTSVADWEQLAMAMVDSYKELQAETREMVASVVSV